jgi:hypothetical protein
MDEFVAERRWGRPCNFDIATASPFQTHAFYFSLENVGNAIRYASGSKAKEPI